MTIERQITQTGSEVQYKIGDTTILLDKDDYAKIISEGGTLGVRKRKNTSEIRPVVMVRGRNLELGRYLLKAQKGKFIDHINRDPLDNRRSNLRECTVAENTRNRKMHKNNRVGYKGVAKVNGSYQARILVDGEFILLGCYHIKELAARVYDLAALEYHGEFAVTNFPKEEILAWKPEWEKVKGCFE